MAQGEGGGRPTKYRAKYHNEQALKLTRLGLTDEELAENFDIAVSTLNEWKLRYPKFQESIKKGKTATDSLVADSLLKRALGFEYDERTYEKLDEVIDGEHADDDIKVEMFKKKVVTKQVAPDTTAQIFWLKNRQPKLWRDKQEVVNTNKNFNVTMTKDEIKEISKTLDEEC